MSTQKALQRLNDPADGGATDTLAVLLLEQLFATRADEVLPLNRAAAWARLALESWLASPEAPKTLERGLEEAVNRLSARKQSLREVVPKDLQATLLEVYGRPYSPDRRVVMALLDRPPMRELIRTLVLDTVTAFGSRMAAPAASVTKGLGGLARFAAEQVKSRGGALGGLVGAVSNEVQNQLEKRAGDFADAAIGSVLAEIVDAVCDPKRAHEAAALRVEVMKGALDLTLPQLSRELINLDLPGGAEVLRQGAQKWLKSGEATRVVEQVVAEVKSEKTFGEVLASLGQLEPARVIGRELLRHRLHPLFASNGYAKWLEDLMRD